MTRLFVVTETFTITQRGLVLAPGPMPGAKVVFGDVVELRRPDGTTARARVAGLATFWAAPVSPAAASKGVPLMLAGLEASDVPAGTEVWTTEAE